MTLTLGLKVSQRLTMTTYMQQAIQILQMSQDELMSFVEEQAQDNPLLDVCFPSHYTSACNQTHHHDIQDVSTATLTHHLLEQLQYHSLPKKDFVIGKEIISSLDLCGYLLTPIREIALQCNASEKQVQKILKLIQTFEPLGVAAHSLSECLIIQLKEKKKLNALMKNFLENLHLIERGNIASIAKNLQISITQAHHCLSEIRRHCNPKPGLCYHASRVNLTIIPDLIAYKEHGKWCVSLNTEAIPRVILNSIMLQDIVAQEYLKKQQASGKWLIDALHKRYQTILAVGKKIVEIQQLFLEYGPTTIQPMSLKKLAAVLDMHESTISRVTSRKFIKTPKGVFSLKSFFAHTITSKDADSYDMCNKGIMDIMVKLIQQEEKKSPYSDEQLMERLRDRGIVIARRTIAKYRKIMNIAPSHIRKMEKTLSQFS